MSIVRSLQSPMTKATLHHTVTVTVYLLAVLQCYRYLGKYRRIWYLVAHILLLPRLQPCLVSFSFQRSEKVHCARRHHGFVALRCQNWVVRQRCIGDLTSDRTYIAALFLVSRCCISLRCQSHMQRRRKSSMVSWSRFNRSLSTCLHQNMASLDIHPGPQ